ncbi:MAG: hypothetical protein LBK91_07675, partial [Synergistaceae bacterium]|jgi:hypothetical protein|nr:hypothetical protein [Synergistaceae bacterium]
VDELSSHFNMRAVALTASTASRLERSSCGSVFEHYPFTVVSLDYIKSENHRDNFLHMAPECVVVDEAHTCTLRGRGRQRRFELLKALSEETQRHMIMLTATPHSGDDDAFHNLLSILRKDFLNIQSEVDGHSRLRDQLSRYFVQRRRKDIDEWNDQNFFPTRMTKELTYKLSGAWEVFFDDVRAYCASLAVKAEKKGSPLIWFVSLALLRCVASSPAAAARALATKLTTSADRLPKEGEAYADERSIFDGDIDDLSLPDIEPPAIIEGSEENTLLKKLIREADNLTVADNDPKLAALEKHLRLLLNDGFNPVVFCRYIATAKYVAEKLAIAFDNVPVESVTGELPSDERMERVLSLVESERRILVATDCLSEGVNLQDYFDALVHYDLAWNPTRHEQREGRVDRFGQRSPEVRCAMIYGENNPVDGLILKVILKKAEIIRRELGIMVPLPDDDAKLQQALVKSVILKGLKKIKTEAPRQLTLGFDDEPDFSEVGQRWQNAVEKMKKNRTIFAQRSLKPADVLPEWEREQYALGNPGNVKKFVLGATGRLGSPLASVGKKGTYALTTSGFEAGLKGRLREQGLSNNYPIDFRNPPMANTNYIHRSHPLVTALADELLETALSSDPSRRAVVSRCAVTITRDVKKLTRIYLLRIRHQLTSMRGGKSHPMMAEEMATVAFEGTNPPSPMSPENAGSLLEVNPSANALNPEVYIREAIEFWDLLGKWIDEFASLRAKSLREDHMRVKDASNDSGRYDVKPCLPPDLLGVYVLLPDAEEL